ncbi:MAG: bifunctional phosphoribosylaminoimidazolecarboxamide formyltransferase/IMP cyclohydrolase [Rhodospirillales bacterium]|nr:bifunctional phosphoribosylaminoimidazolecarboxamide formyltransferase/IMP cyclohydrolase [Rhodospirillales bacterium]
MTPPIRRALISVSDKTGLVQFARFLAEWSVHILSTGGTAKALAEAGIPVTEVSDHTGFPEIMDGRVKTLHPKVHGGLLAIRGDAAHEKALRDLDIAPIDLLVVNLYPFEASVARGADFKTAIENIDIGGPALIRGAAKNHDFVTAVVDPADYQAVMDEMRSNEGATSAAFRRRLAAQAFARTATYDAAISAWLGRALKEPFPQRLALAGELRQMLRYGENPHQRAAFYAATTEGIARPGIATAAQVQGKELSFNNLNDTDAAFELVAEFRDGPACAIIKHANPCGVALGSSLADAYGKALACDPVSAFGGILAFNRPLDGATAESVAKLFTEAIVVPEADADARRVLSQKKNLRLLVTGGMPDPAAPGMTVRSLAGGLLLQDRDAAVAGGELRVVTKRKPSEREMADLLFAFTVCKHVKSNAIVYAREGATVGIGAGQMSRVDSSRIAAWKAAEAGKAAGLKESPAIGSVVASDAFFPFADGLVAAADAGATAVIQPGGSVRDEEVIAAADARSLAMVFTGVRHFRH